jgi:hypothetical protein
MSRAEPDLSLWPTCIISMNSGVQPASTPAIGLAANIPYLNSHLRNFGGFRFDAARKTTPVAPQAKIGMAYCQLNFNPPAIANQCNPFRPMKCQSPRTITQMTAATTEMKIRNNPK